MRSKYVSLLCLAVLMHLPCTTQELTLDLTSFSSTWEQTQSGTALGNFPPGASYRVPHSWTELSTPADQWTTFPVQGVQAPFQRDDQNRPLSKLWEDPSEPLGVRLTPLAAGRDNRLLLQLSLDGAFPLTPPFTLGSSVPGAHENDTSVGIRRKKEYARAWELMQKGLFNCHINRGVEKDFFRKRFPNFNYPIQKDIDAAKELKEKGKSKDILIHEPFFPIILHPKFKSRAEVLPCVAGSNHPLCCYVPFGGRTLRAVRKAMGFTAYDFNEDRACVQEQNYTSENAYKEGHCPVAKEEIEYTLRRDDLTCNKHTFRSALSCKEKDKTKEGGEERDKKRVFPCSASCYEGMIVQVEIIPVEGGSGSSEVDVTVVSRRYRNFDQPEFGKKSPRYFGWQMSKASKTEYLGTTYKDLDLQLSVNKSTGLWIQWLERTGNIGPVLRIGKEGSFKPLIEHDFSSVLMTFGLAPDPFGFRFGWRGVEMQKPRITDTFRPRFVALNGVRGGAPFSYEIELTRAELDSDGNEFTLRDTWVDAADKLTAAPVLVAVGSGVLVVLLLLMAWLCWKRNAGGTKKTTTKKKGKKRRGRK